MISLTLYDPFDRMQFGSDICFLCGTPTSATDTIPVFPGWLQQRYNLTNKQLQLLDKSIITYPDLTIPCCPVCWEQHLQPLEDKVEAAHDQGVAGFKALDEKDVFLWLSKIFYGILVRELMNEKNPLIMPEHAVGENPKMFIKFQAFYKLLQALRVPIVFDDFTPCSLFVLEVAETDDTVPFEYRDELTTMMFSIKMGRVVLICCLLDNGLLQQALQRVYDTINDKPLHPIQVAEFTARVYYAAYLLNIIPEYFERKASPSDDFLTYDTLIDDITMDIFNPWENSAYAKVLEEMWKKWQITREQILKNPQEPMTMLYDETGALRNIVSFPPVI
ncbi:hypothetical protein AAE02nite_38500 [Adhaeribacter aerolatus]|uniref:Uncharacterized protein n=1 Tax=Adhaeribacter aerolatus TaxID=670289 RepID=A0A512B2J2_9BACT|nr:hypothetical protein [Adhaeribacter aerolatus]GEO06186.1 hypothetical protein AAE02nite_38500 [Adhaeribacter aerolatus]